MLSIDHYAYCNGLKNIHSFEKFLFAMLTMAVSFFIKSIAIQLIIIAVMVFCVILLAKIPWHFYLKLLLIPISFLVIGIITIIISVETTSGLTRDWVLYRSVGKLSIGVSYTELLLGAQIMVKSLTTVSCLYFLALTTPMVDVISLLKKFKVPQLFIELMGLTYRFIFVLIETAQQIVVSQSSRCGYSSFKTSFRSISQTISSMFIKSFRKSNMMYTSLMSRGYTGELRVLEKEQALSKANISLIIIFETVLVITAILSGGV